MRNAPTDFDNDGLLHFGAGHNADFLLMMARYFCGRFSCVYFSHLLSFYLVAKDGLHPGLVLAKFTHPLQGFGLSHGPLETKTEHLLLHFGFLMFQFVCGQIPHFFQSFGCLHDYSVPFSIRMTNLVCTGSFAAASFIASRATDSGTPSIS